jgi:hypothetical protein
MEHLTINPHEQHCPDFASGAFQQARQLTIDAGHAADHEAAAQSLTINWRGWNEEQRNAWDAQVLADEQAAEEAQHVAKEQAAAAQAAAVNKPFKMNTIKPGQFISADLDIQPTAYAMARVENGEHVDLWYFGNEGCTDAAHAPQSIINDALAVTKDGDSGCLTLQPYSTSSPSTRARKDHDLTFPQFLTVYKRFIQHIIDAGWPAVNVASLNALFTTLEMHPFHRVKHGEAALLLYQSHVRAHWHDHIKADKGFEIHIIDNTKLNIYMVEVADAARALEERMVRAPKLPLAMQNPNQFFFLTTTMQ